MKPSAIDQRRLRDGAAALEASSRMPRTHAGAEWLRTQLSDAIAAMQSLDDLGEDRNQQAQRDLDELGRRYRALEALYPAVESKES